MKRSLAVPVLLLCGCIQINSEFVPPAGLIYTSVKAPLTTRFNNTQVSDRKVTEKKEFLQLPIRVGGSMPSIGFEDDTYGDKPYYAARLIEVAYSDYEYTSLLGVYASTRITYYGK